MGREPVVPDWPPLTLAEVRPLLATYGLDALRLTWRSPRPFSAAALVECAERSVFVKRHGAAVRNAQALAEEHALADHLRYKGIPVPEVLADAEGHRTRSDGPWTWEVHAVGAGDDLYRKVLSWEPFRSPAHAHAVGAALARLSTAVADYDAPARPPRLLTTSWGAVAQPDLLAGLTQHVEDRPLLRAALARRDWQTDVARHLVPLHADLVPHLPRLPAGWTHGDGHPSNFLWRGDDVVTVLDLGLADRTTPLLDLATAVERSCVSWLDAEPAGRPDDAEALIAGWSSVTAVDRSALAALLPLAHVEFALSELAYFTGVTGSAENAALAYDGYLLGHARWFRSPAGAELLARVRG